MGRIWNVLINWLILNWIANADPVRQSYCKIPSSILLLRVNIASERRPNVQCHSVSTLWQMLADCSRLNALLQEDVSHRPLTMTTDSASVNTRILVQQFSSGGDYRTARPPRSRNWVYLTSPKCFWKHFETGRALTKIQFHFTKL